MARDLQAWLDADNAGNELSDPMQRAVAREAAVWTGGAKIGESIGRYPVLDLLGEGGTGRVYAVYDHQLERRVALKLIDTAHDKRSRKRILREARAMAQLSHPNVVPVFEVGEHGGQLFIVMEFVQGVTLRRWAEDERSWLEVLRAYLQAGRGLAAAHASGLVHRDFKPHNAVIGEDGRVRVLDFGLAARGDASGTYGQLETPLTDPGSIMGTPAYMSPEQFLGDPVDKRSDQFSFCVSLWEALYGTQPFAGDNPIELVGSVVRGEISEPGRTNAPAATRKLLERGLATDPSERWPDLPELLDALEALAVDPARRRRTRRIFAAVGGTALVFAVGVPTLNHQLRVRAERECDAEASGEVSEAWSPHKRARVRDGLLATEVSYAEAAVEGTFAELDRYAQRWQQVRANACISARVDEIWSADDLGRSRWCLEERALDLSSLVEALEQEPMKRVREATAAVAQLKAVEECANVELLRRLPAPPSTEEREAADGVRALVAKAGALGWTGDFKGGLVAAKTAAREAEHLNMPSLHAEAMAQQATLTRRVGEFAEAESLLTEAFFLAQAAHDYKTAFRASLGLMEVVGMEGDRHDGAMLWSRHSEYVLGELALGPDHPLVARRLRALAGVHYAGGAYAKARPLLERALEIQESALGPESFDTLQTASSLGIVHYLAGDRDKAKIYFTRALEGSEARHGPDHPEVAQHVGNLALVFDGAEALALHERSLAIREAVHGPDHPDVGHSLVNVGVAQRDNGKLAAAKNSLGRALVITKRSFGPEHSVVGLITHNLGKTASLEGDHATAKTLHQRALAIRQKSLPPGHPDILESLNELATVHQILGESAAEKRVREQISALDK